MVLVFCWYLVQCLFYPISGNSAAGMSESGWTLQWGRVSVTRLEHIGLVTFSLVLVALGWVTSMHMRTRGLLIGVMLTTDVIRLEQFLAVSDRWVELAPDLA